jgi:capsular exopolysaccharide synthesis family protein
LRRWWWLLALSGPVGAAIAYFLTSLSTPVYQSTATLLISERSETGVVRLVDLQASEGLAFTFVHLVTLQPVMEQAAIKLEAPLTPDQIRGRVAVSHPATTQLLRISARSTVPEQAQAIANVVAESFIESNEAELASRPGVVTIVERARTPGAPVSPRPKLNAALGFMLSGLIVTGLLVTYTYIDDTIRTPATATQLTGITTLGSIASFKRPRAASEQIRVNDRDSSIAEQFRSTRTALNYALQALPHAKVVLVASPRAGDGKTTSVANLGAGFAMTGRRVLLVDADLRNPTLHQIFSLENGAGLSTVAMGQTDSYEAAVQETSYPNLRVMTSGPLPGNRSELLGSAQVAALIAKLREDFDIVMLDTPPVLGATDASVLVELADASVVVVQAGKTKSRELMSAVADLDLSSRPVVGLILNRAKARDQALRAIPYYGEAIDRTAREVQPS